MHDPFSMRPFFGYNFGQYLQHWLDIGARLASPPLVFMVNWFRSHVATRDHCHIVFFTRSFLVQEGAEWRPAVAWLRGQHQGH